jgi:hypothetical protein
MLAKMRLVMIEKWEGHCWQDCLSQGVGSPPCEAGCDVEAIIMDTLRRIKAINPSVSGVLYLNTLLAFPFYALNGLYEGADALTIDSSTGKPIVIRNECVCRCPYPPAADTTANASLSVLSAATAWRVSLCMGSTNPWARSYTSTRSRTSPLAVSSTASLEISGTARPSQNRTGREAGRSATTSAATLPRPPASCGTRWEQ